ncbi:MAG: bifunctional DNA primase/polymerase [Candidatus Taylorbacteria bacterium]|nr:bifunctional DNA primase/polymerase [Candidatus Taylorbacteria bacterium]
MENIILECALNYASLGWSVFPCHSIRNGKCTCENDGCDKKGKHPRTPHGYKDGTTDVEKIRKYWTKFPYANIGCATGQVSKIVVLDLDTKHGNSVQVMMKKMSSLGFNIPATASARTGEYLQDKERGAHFFFNCSGVPIESVTNILENVGIKGVDIRADKGYVILAPSAHFTGVSYEWQVSPMLVGLADLPSWIIQKLHTDPESAGKSENKDWGKIFNAEALEGMRNDTATKVAGKLLQAMPSEAWPLGWDLLKAWNLRLTKPLNLGELKTVWNSVEKREKSSKKNKEELTKPEPRVRIPKCPAPSRTVDFEEWAKIISANFPDLRFASEISLAVIAQFLIKDITNPFALVLVDVPSSGKTITINFFSDIPELTYSSDKFTPASFVSNSANVKKEKLGEIDLLPRIQYRMFLIRDMATLFAKRDEDLNELLGILTRVLDGEGLNTDSGVHGQREYNGEYLFMILAQDCFF